MKKRNSKKRLPPFWRIFIIAVTCAVILIITGAFAFAAYMSQYESSLPETVITEYAENLGTDRLAGYLIKNFPNNIGNFLTKEQVVHEIILPIIGENISYEKRPGEYSTEAPVYTLIAGGRNIARVHFSMTGKTFFGFDKWGEAELEYEADFSDLHYDAFYIKVPGGSAVTFEGSRLGLNYVVRTEKYYGPSAEFENTVKLPICEVFNAGEGYGSPRIVVFSGNTQLSVMSDESDEETRAKTISYSLSDSKLHSLTFIIPPDAKVTVNGKTVSQNYISETDIPYDIPNKWDEYADPAPRRIKYVLAGLVTTDLDFSVSAYDGTLLSPINADETTGTYEYEYPSALLTTAVIYAPPEAIVTVNSIELTANELKSEITTSSEIKSIEQFVENPSKTCVYSISGLRSKPNIEMKTASGKQFTVVMNSDGTFGYEPENSETLKAEHAAYVEEFTENYIKYYTDGKSQIKENFDNLILPYLQIDSEAYTYLNAVYGSLAWTEKCTVSKQSIETYSYQLWGNNCFSCSVDFSIEFYSPNSESSTDENVKNWQLFFVNSSGSKDGWKIAKIVFH